MKMPETQYKNEKSLRLAKTRNKQSYYSQSSQTICGWCKVRTEKRFSAHLAKTQMRTNGREYFRRSGRLKNKLDCAVGSQACESACHGRKRETDRWKTRCSLPQKATEKQTSWQTRERTWTKQQEQNGELARCKMGGKK